MGVYKFSLKMLRTNLKQSVLYILAIMLPTTIIVNLLNIMTNSYFLSAKGKEGDIPADIIFFWCLLYVYLRFTQIRILLQVNQRKWPLQN